MGGGGGLGGIAKTVGRGLGAVVTGGMSETLPFANKLTHGRIGPLNSISGYARKAGGGIGDALTLGLGRGGAPDLQPGAGGGQDPAELLAQTGGAPLLANIAMGVDPEDALAGYFGKNKQDGSWEEFLGTLSQKDFDAINSVHGQLNTIQSNRELRQKAVDKTIQDFPNIVKQSRDTYGGMFDEDMKKYVDQALNNTASKFAAGGGLSSGAANEAFARVGAENAVNRLNYTTTNAVRDAGLRLTEVNALRDFQNTMLGNGVSQGFSAQQANLQRQFQGQQANAEMANQRNLADQASQNALFGSLGSLGGTFIGASMFGPIGGAAGSKIGGSLFGSPAPKLTNTSYDSFAGRA